MTRPADMSVRELAAAIRNRTLSSEEIVRDCLDRIRSCNPRLNAFIEVFDEEAAVAARALDAELAAGADRGPLHGIPVAVKDIIDIRGRVNSAGGVLLPQAPAAQDAPVIARLRAAGAVILGRLNLHEYAWGGTTDNPHFGPCFNPWREGFTPGGSSGGSGAAVAARLCPVALGTDTLGSVRIPASYCGVTGFKPSFGLVSKRGCFPLSWSLDSIGPLARSADDAAVTLAAIAEADADDPWSAMREPSPAEFDPPGGVRGMKLGVIRDWSLRDNGTREEIEVRDSLRAAIGILSGLGADCIEIDAPEFPEATATAIAVTMADAAAIHEERLRDHPGKISDSVRGRLEIGRAMTAEATARAHARMRELRHALTRRLAHTDAVLTPSTSTASHAFDLKLASGTARYTAPWNLLGAAAISVPSGFTSDGLPTGLMIGALPGGGASGEAKALRVARAWQEATEHHLRSPGPEAWYA